MKYSKAEVAPVDFGFCKVEGLMLPDGSYAMAITQANKFLKFSGSPQHATRSLKRLLGEGFEPPRVLTELNSNKVYIITIDEFKQIVRELDKQGNPIASAFIDAALTEAVERRFDTAFNVKRTEEDRNARMKLRVTRLLARRKWTDQLQRRHIELFGFPPSSDQFREWTVKANLVLFSKPHFCCDRDTMTIDEQLIIESFETLCCRKASQYPQDTPDEILQKVFAAF